MGKSSINGPFSMAMLNNQRVVPIVTTAEPTNATRGHHLGGGCGILDLSHVSKQISYNGKP